MKKIFIIAAGILMIACNDQKKETKLKFSDLSLDKIKGDVSSIEETPYKADSTGKPGDMDSCCVSVTSYDENGNAVNWTSADSKGVKKEEAVFAHYENGLWKSQKSTKNGKPSGGFETQMDDKGIYTGGQEIDSNGKMTKYYTGLTQNEFGETLTWKQYDKDSVFRMEGENKYQDGQWVAFTGKDSVGKKKSESSSKYNDKGEQTEYSNTTITKDSTTTKVTKYTYEAHDEQGNWTQRTAWDEKGKGTGVTKRKYTYTKKEEEKK
jgi:hypothetical protein